MFIGHFAVALGIKRLAPEIKLGTAILAATFVDVLWPLFLAAGWEVVKISPGDGTEFTPLRFVSYPFTHSLTMVVLWAGLFALAYKWSGGSRKAASWLGLLVISHWFLDLIVHAPDLQLFPEVDIYVGLGLWNSVPGTLIVEGFLFAAGVGLYLSATRARDAIGTWGFWGLVLFLLAAYFGAAFGSPPHNLRTLVIVSLVGIAATLALAYWVDAHRKAAVG